MATVLVWQLWSAFLGRKSQSQNSVESGQFTKNEYSNNNRDRQHQKEFYLPNGSDEAGQNKKRSERSHKGAGGYEDGYQPRAISQLSSLAV